MAGPVGAHAAANLDLMSTLNKHAQQLELMETGACVAEHGVHILSIAFSPIPINSTQKVVEITSERN